MRRSFGRMNEEMICERMFRVDLQDAFQRREDLFGARVRLTLRSPLVPRAQVHHRLRKQGADIRVVRIFVPDLPHRVGVGEVERGAVRGLRVSITMAQRLDQVALDRRGMSGVLLRELQFLPGQLGGRRRNQREIDVRPAGERNPVVRHRAFRIEARGFLKRADRLPVIETVIKGEALVEIPLSLRRIGRDLSLVLAEPGEYRFLFRVGRIDNNQRRRHQRHNTMQSSHDFSSPPETSLLNRLKVKQG